MSPELGKRYAAVSGVEVIVTKGGGGELECAGKPMSIGAAESSAVSAGGDAETAVQLGKRYRCEACGAEVLCTKPGDGPIVCDGAVMEIMEPRPLPSSD